MMYKRNKWRFQNETSSKAFYPRSPNFSSLFLLFWGLFVAWPSPCPNCHKPRSCTYCAFSRFFSALPSISHYHQRKLFSGAFIVYEHVLIVCTLGNEINSENENEARIRPAFVLRFCEAVKNLWPSILRNKRNPRRYKVKRTEHTVQRFRLNL